MARRRPREPDGQGAGDRAGPAGDPHADRRGHQRQRHAAVLRRRSTSEVADAYIAGLEDLVAQGRRPRQVASVASFFVSRIDTRSTSARREDRRRQRSRREARALDGPAGQGRDRQRQARLPALQAHLRRRALGAAGAAKGAQTQRLLWASTGTKNQAYQRRALRRGADRRRHGQHDAAGDDGRLPRPRPACAPSLEEDVAERAGASWRRWPRPASRSTRSPTGWSTTACGCSPTPLDKLLGGRRRRSAAHRCSAAGSTGRAASCRRSSTTAVEAELDDWRKDGKVRRLWAGDAALWTGDGRGRLARLARRRRRAAARASTSSTRSPRTSSGAGFSRRRCCSAWAARAWPRGARRRPSAASRACPSSCVARLDRPGADRGDRERDRSRDARCSSCRASPAARSSRTSSSSISSTRAQAAVGAERGGAALRRDHRSRLLARAGRASARLPAHLPRPRRRSAAATRCCRTSAWCRRRRSASTFAGSSDATARDGALLRRRACRRRRTRASLLGVDPGRRWRSSGRDKVTLIASPGIADLGAWLEQLLAESTGKQGKGIDPGRRRAARHRRPSTATTGCSPTCGSTARRRTHAQDSGGRGAGGAPASRSCASTCRRHDAARPGVLPLGDRDRGRRRDPRHQPVRPAGRRGEQGQDPRADRRLRERPARCRRETPLCEGDGSSCSPTRRNAAALGRRARPASSRLS